MSGGKRVISVTCALAVLWVPAAADQPFFMGLGDLPGGAFESFARAVSADGTVVVGWSVSTLGTEGFRRTDSQGMVGLGDFPGGIFLSKAYGVSADGAAIAGTGVTASGAEAYRWTAATGMVGLGYLPGRKFASHGRAMSADGLVIVGASGTSNMTSDLVAYRWTQATGMIALGSLPGSPGSATNAVSGDGTTVVGVAGFPFQAFRWTAATGLVGLGFLPGGTLSGALGANTDGSVAVGIARAPDSQAMRWTDATGIVVLGDLPGGVVESYAWATSADGFVIVGVGTGVRGQEAFIWDDQRGMRSLRDVLINEYGLELNDWHLEQAYDVTPDGTTIVGYGSNPAGDTEAWIAHIHSMCPADINGDGMVDLADLGILLADFGCVPPGPCVGDIDADGDTDLADLGILLANFGMTCP